MLLVLYDLFAWEFELKVLRSETKKFCNFSF